MAKNTKKSTNKNSDFLLDKLIDQMVEIDMAIKNSPDLSEIDRARFNQDIALSHLYYSSRIEGTILTNKQIEGAIYGGKKEMGPA